jgi:glycosyl transferase, family 25
MAAEHAFQPGSPDRGIAVDAVYVLSVKTFADRIAHVQRELGRHGIRFEFVFDYDAADLDAATMERYFAGAATSLPKQMSLVLKHLQAWRLACERGQRRILVFEDDVILDRHFRARMAQALAAADALAPGWLIFLGGADTKVPDRFFLHPGPLVPLANSTAEGYVTDLEACRRRLAWCDAHKIAHAADHLLTLIDREQDIVQYWPLEPLVEQGSVVGLFDSVLDSSRMKHSRGYNIARHRWTKWRRRTLRKHWIRMVHGFSGKAGTGPA